MPWEATGGSSRGIARAQNTEVMNTAIRARSDAAASAWTFVERRHANTRASLWRKRHEVASCCRDRWPCRRRPSRLGSSRRARLASSPMPTDQHSAHQGRSRRGDLRNERSATREGIFGCAFARRRPYFLAPGTAGSSQSAVETRNIELVGHMAAWTIANLGEGHASESVRVRDLTSGKIVSEGSPVPGGSGFTSALVLVEDGTVAWIAETSATMGSFRFTTYTTVSSTWSPKGPPSLRGPLRWLARPCTGPAAARRTRPHPLAADGRSAVGSLPSQPSNSRRVAASSHLTARYPPETTGPASRGEGSSPAADPPLLSSEVCRQGGPPRSGKALGALCV